MDNLDDFFEPNAVAETEVEQTEVEVAEPQTETIETPQDEVTETVPEAQTEVESKSGIPVGALQAEREKTRIEREEVARLRTELESYRAQQAPQAQQPQTYAQANIPDPYDDPAGYHNYVMQSARQEIQLQNLVVSRDRALQQHGEEIVTAAADWAAQEAARDPSLEARILSQPDPAAWVIAQHKRSELLKNFETDPDAYVRARAAELGIAQVAPVVMEAQVNTARKPLQSIVSAKSRDQVTTTPEDSFDAIFKK